MEKGFARIIFLSSLHFFFICEKGGGGGSFVRIIFVGFYCCDANFDHVVDHGGILSMTMTKPMSVLPLV